MGKLTVDSSGQVWMEATAQIFFSYSVGVGSLTVLSSYNNYNYNCYKQVLPIKFNKTTQEHGPKVRWNSSVMISPLCYIVLLLCFSEAACGYVY